MAAKWVLLYTETITSPVSNITFDLSSYTDYKDFMVVPQNVQTNNDNAIQIYGANSGTRNASRNENVINISTNTTSTTQYFNSYATNGQLNFNKGFLSYDNSGGNATIDEEYNGKAIFHNLNDIHNASISHNSGAAYIESSNYVTSLDLCYYENTNTLTYNELDVEPYLGGGTIASGKLLLFGFQRN